jgi:tetratricopeptide (TPR) repeat protein
VNHRRLISCLLLSAGSLGAKEASWTRLDAQNFVILSEVSEEETRSWAIEFDQFHRGLGKVLKINESLLQPVTVVLFRSQGALRPYKPLEKGKPANIDGLFVRSSLGNFIEAAADSEDDETRRLIFHEGVHWMTNVSDTPLPLWLDEGLAEVFSTFSIDGDLYSYGKALDWHVILLTRGKRMPLKELLGIQRGSLLYNEGDRTSIFYAESWAFVHYLLFSGQLEERAKYNQLLRALRGHADPDIVFKQVFGVDCAGMDKRLEDYLYNGNYTINRIRFDRSAVNKSFKVRPATRAEVNLAECELLTVVNRPSEALPRLRELVRAMQGDPAPWEAEGFAAYQTEDYGEAESSFRRASELGSRSYFVYSFLGDATLGIHPGGVMPAVVGDIRVAADYYERELQLNARDQHAYDNIAGNAYGMETLTATDAKTLQDGAQLFPDDGAIKVGMAVVDLKQGHADTAIPALRRISADMSPANREVSAYAQTILDDRMRIDAFNQIQDLWQRREYDKVVAFADGLLKTNLSAPNRESVTLTRVRAKVASKIQQAVDLANSGQLPEAKRLLLEAVAESPDEQMKRQIQSLLDRISADPRAR